MRPIPSTPAEAARPAEAESRRYRDLLEVAVSLTSTLELKAILDTIVDGIIRVTSCERGFVILREADGTFATFTGRTREGDDWDERSAREISHSVVARVLDRHEPFVGTDIDKIDELRGQESILEQKIRSAVCLPLIYQDRLIGVIYADSSFVIAPFVETDRDVLRAFGAQAALAIMNAQRHGEILDRGDRLVEQNRKLREQLSHHVTMSGMVIRNKRMLDLFAMVEKLAAADISSVVIHGESGTGKELLARALHELSPRRDGPFAAVNSSNLTSGVAESILFGHCRGAFTGAESDRAGYFEVAHGGTLFLDEIGDMPVDIQPRLLRALQQREITRMGEPGRVRKVDVHIVAATNRDIPRAIAEGNFREDLYYRINVAELHVPPLRERPEDIIPLAEYFLQRLAGQRNQPAPQLSRDARRVLLEKRWDGNVRELENLMEWAIAFRDEHGIIHADALQRPSRRVDAAVAADDAVGSLREVMERFEARVIRDALARNDSNVSSTAKALGLSRQMLHEKIKKYGIVTRGE
ncbi:MAG TPA: sigma 54-interacting transcriptional regulator [Candidatus Krumholzibacteria bacterium]